MEYLKKSTAPIAENDVQIQNVVKEMLAKIDIDGESAVYEYAAKFDGWEGEFVLSDERRQEIIASVPEQDEADIRFAYEQVKAFAVAQRDSIQEFEIETHPGVKLGQKVLPVNCAGC